MGDIGIWSGGRIGIGVPSHCPLDTVESATSRDGVVPSSGVSPSGQAASSSDCDTSSGGYAAPPSGRDASSGGYASSPRGHAASSGRAATSPIEQQPTSVRVTTRAGAINHTSDSTPIHRDAETDTDVDI